MFKLILLLSILSAISHSQEPSIIDFTYTQLLEETNSTGGPQDQIIIQPETRQLEKYQFPEVCELEQMLKQGTDSSGQVDKIINLDDYLHKLREKILRLLTLAQEIKSSRSYLAEIHKHLQMSEDGDIESRFQNQLQELAKKESQLQSDKQKIQTITEELNKKIELYNNNPKNEQFKTISLEYQIENYQTKINYLQFLKDRSIRKSRSQPHTNFTDFFKRLTLELSSESKQLQMIDKYFQNMSHLSYLRDSVNSLADNIEVDRLNIEYKKSCQKQKRQIVSKTSTHSQIKQTLDHLRQKKKELGNTTNKYCQGVALKLQTQIKRLLKAINWTFTCADGLNQLIDKRNDRIRTLQQKKAQIQKYSSQGFDTYQDKYEDTKDNIRAKFRDIKTFTIDEYSHDPQHVEQLIQQAKKGKEQASQKLKNLPKQVSGDKIFDQIKALAQQLKKLKAKFCHEYGLYDNQQRKIWFYIFNFERSLSFAAKMRGEYITQSQKLLRLQNDYKQLSEVVTKQIVDNYIEK